MAPRMQNGQQEDVMIGIMIVIAGLLLLMVRAGTRRPAVQPVRSDEHKERNLS